MKSLLTVYAFLSLFLTLSSPGLRAGGGGEGEGKKPGLEDFAGNLELTGEPGVLLRFELPGEVYRGLERPDRGDGGALPENGDIEINAAGAVVRIRNREGGGRQGEAAYLLDLAGLSGPPSSLVLELDHRGAAFNAAVTLHAGEDLSRWRRYEGKQVVARLGPSQASPRGIDRNVLELPPAGPAGGPRYLLLGLGPGAPPPVKIYARFDPRPLPSGVREGLLQG